MNNTLLEIQRLKEQRNEINKRIKELVGQPILGKLSKIERQQKRSGDLWHLKIVSSCCFNPQHRWHTIEIERKPEDIIQKTEALIEDLQEILDQLRKEAKDVQ